MGHLARVPVVVNTNHGLYATEDDRPLRRTVVPALQAVAAQLSHAELIQKAEDLDLLLRRRIKRHQRT